MTSTLVRMVFIGGLLLAGLVAPISSFAHGGHGGHGHGGHGHSHYTYPQWHDTSHYHYQPGYVYRHGDHFHYQPGRYHYHQTGHWHW